MLGSAVMTNEETIKMAVKKKLPVQPIVFSKFYFINKEKHFFEPGMYRIFTFYLIYFELYLMSFISGRVIISVMPILETDGLMANDLVKFSDEISTKIRAEYDCISKLTELRDYQTPNMCL